MANTPRVLTVRLKPGEGETTVLVEHGTVELEKRIPERHGVTRISAIFDAAGRLYDVELVTEKVE